MSQLKEPNKVKLFINLIYTPDSAIEELMLKLEERLSKVDFISNEIAFDHSQYYQSEMGGGLLRKLFTFENLIKRTDIIGIKAFTNKLEEVFSYEGNRTINIDPGYIAQEHVILATGKGYSHRPYLGNGVYADLTLIYKKDEYHTLQWTYPDYGNKEMRDLVKSLREKYVSQLAKEPRI